jgi:biotin synthase-like enzyme
MTTTVDIATAEDVRRANHGDRFRLHSVIYPIDYCTSGCTYCGLSTLLAKEKAHGVRGGMPPETFKFVLEQLVAAGYGIHELVFGTVALDQEKLAERIARWVDRARAVDPDGYIIVNCDTLQPAGYRRLRDCGVDAIWTFMEVMSPEIYRQKHTSGLKSDQEQRFEAPLRIRDAGMAVGNALLWGLAEDWQQELGLFTDWAAQVGGFDFVATPVQQSLTLPAGTKAPSYFDVDPPLRIGTDLYQEIVANLRMAFPTAHLVGNTRLDPKFVYGEVSRIADMCNGYVWTGARSHPRAELAAAGHVRSESTQMDFHNPGISPEGIRKLCPDSIDVSLNLPR